MANIDELLARVRAAKLAQDKRLAAEVVDTVLTVDTLGEFHAGMCNEDCAELSEPAPISPAPEHKPVAVAAGYTAVYGSILQETEKAILFSVKQPYCEGDLNTEAWWIPISQVSYVCRSKFHLPYRDLIHVKDWIRDKQGYKPNKYSTGIL